MPKRYNNIIYKLLLRSKIIKVILSSMTRIGPIICIEDSEEAFSVNHIYMEEDTKVKETTVVDIVITSYPVGNNAISVINLDTSQASI